MNGNNIKISTPEESLNKFLKWFSVEKRIAFITAFVIGIITHITMITETIMSQDGLWNSMQYFRPGDWEITLGRWGILLVERLNNFIALPSIATVSCIFIMSITAVILVDIFEFKSKISTFIVSAMLVLTPTLTVTLLYVYTSLAYCFCMMLSCLTVWFMYKFKYKKIGIVLSIITAILTFAIYQSYIGLTIALVIAIGVLTLIRNDKVTLKEVFKKILYSAVIILVAGILYLIVTKIVLAIFNLEITNYRDYENSFLEIILNIKDSIFSAYKDFFAFFFRDRIVYNTNYRRDLLYGAFFVILVVFGIINIISIKAENKKEKVLKIITAFCLLLLLPLALNVINIIVVNYEIYALTASQMILIIPITLALIESTDKFLIGKWLMVIVCLAIMLTYYIADNTSYAALKLTYNQAYSTTERLIDRIETTKGYDSNFSIVFGGIIGNNNFPRTSNLYGYTVGSVFNNTVFHGTYSGQIGTWVSFIKVFFGLDVNVCDENTYYRIVTSEEYEEMDIFPAENSIKIRDGIIIVKLSDDPPLPF